jgi:hypothetical protein
MLPALVDNGSREGLETLVKEEHRGGRKTEIHFREFELFSVSSVVKV